MEVTLQIREYQNGDTPTLIRLLSAFYDTIRSEEDWRHLYMDNPAGRAVISLSEASPDRRLLGHYSAIPIYFSIFGEDCRCGKGEGEIFDLSAVKELLSKGVSLKRDIATDLVRHTLKGAAADKMEFVCTNPSNLAFKSHQEAGYQPLSHRLDIFVLILKKRYLIHLLSKKIRFRLPARLLGLVVTFVLRILFKAKVLLSGKKRIALEEIASFGESADIFMSEFRKPCQTIMIKRDSTHLNWRFSGPEYRKFLIRSEDKAIGYIVLHIFKNPNGFHEAALIDYLLLPGSWDEFIRVLIEIEILVRRQGCDFVRIDYIYDYKENFGISRMLKSLFFLSRPDERNIMVFFPSSSKLDSRRILDIRNWYFTDLYFEGY